MPKKARNRTSISKRDVAGEVIGDLARYSFECEWRRYESLLGTSGRMIAGLSLVFVALATSLSFLFDILALIKVILIWELLGVFALLMVSLLFAVLAQYRFSYKGLKSPIKLVSYVDRYKHFITDDFIAQRTIARNLEKPHKSLSDLNDKIADYLRWSNAFLMITLVLIALSALVNVAVICSLG